MAEKKKNIPKVKLNKKREDIFAKAIEELKKEQELKEEFTHLEKITKKPCKYHVKKALVRYIEDMEDIRDIEKYIERKKQGKVKYYTSKEADQRLKELRAKDV